MSSELAITSDQANPVQMFEAEVEWDAAPIENDLHDKIDWCVDKAVLGSQVSANGLIASTVPVLSKCAAPAIASATNAVGEVAKTALKHSVEGSQNCARSFGSW